MEESSLEAKLVAACNAHGWSITSLILTKGNTGDNSVQDPGYDTLNVSLNARK